MKIPFLTRWSVAGFFGVSLLALGVTPLLSEAAAPDEAQTERSQAQTPSKSTSTSSPSVRISPTHSVVPTVEMAIQAATIAATVATHCQYGADGVDEARHLIHYGELEEAERLLRILADARCIDDVQADHLARFQHAHILHRLERPDEVIARLDTLEEETPVDDYVHWLYGVSYMALDQYDEAAHYFSAIYDEGTSLLHWQARAHQSKALVASERYEEARPIVEQLLDLFPDYPRRHLALYHHGLILEELEELDDAAEAYQKAYFEFPYKSEGQLAQQRLERLVELGHEPSEIDPEKRFAQYRQLSIDKFWPLAHELMTELREDVRTEDRNSKLENEILQRIALNTYHRHDFEGAAELFGKARSIYEEGHTAGFSERTIYRFHNFSLARIGRFDEAHEALEALYENSARRTRKRALAEFYERYGYYDEAYDYYEQVYTAGQRRGWHFSYLKYKTGRFDEAYSNLKRLANRSRGGTQAKYRYWAARSLERAGNYDDAAEIFLDIHSTRPNTYYGLQSSSRLLDLEQRESVDDSLLVEANRVGQRAESVFDAFDEAAMRPVSQGPLPPRSQIDPRTRPVGDQIATAANNQLWDRDFIATLYDTDCTDGDGCTPRGLGLPFPTYGLTWNLDQPLLDPRMGDYFQPITTHTAGHDAGAADGAVPAAHIPRRDIDGANHRPPRVRFNTDARIYWSGRHDSDMEFVNYFRGEMIGPTPSQWTAYDDDTHRGGIGRAVDEAGELFPQLERSMWLWNAGWTNEARKLIRDVSLEYRALSSRSRPSGSPHELSHRRWAYLIDNRRRASRADYWGMEPDDDFLRFPVPDDRAARQELLARQQEIIDRRRELRPIVIEALQEVGDYHFVRRFALDDTWWLRHDPAQNEEARRYWMMAYPRAFPEQIIPLSEKYNVNPYMIWALMLVESSFNPDSISIADAKGLMQVIPRTGLKIADLFGADDFGPFDLLEAENSIEQGIFYFSKLVHKFHGQELFAFAGYNGGPHRVSGWLDMRGHDIPHDEFIEEIPFNESRNYAKKVLRFLHTYLRIYEGYDEGLYVGQNVRTDYLPQPDF